MVKILLIDRTNHVQVGIDRNTLPIGLMLRIHTKNSFN